MDRTTPAAAERQEILFPSSMIIPGGQVPKGSIKVSGAKNAATRLLAAALLTDEPVKLLNFPTRIKDAQHKIEFIRGLGFQVDVDHAAEEIDILAGEIAAAAVHSYHVPIRTTYLLAAGQLMRHGLARVPYPGGCQIGSRGYDLHVMVWESLGCRVKELPDYLEIEGELRGSVIDFPISTVGGTENSLLCAAVANGDSEIRNAYITPEVENLIEMLRRMGAAIDVFGNSLIRVRGASTPLRGVRMAVMPDRIEALTWITFAVLTGGELRINDFPFAHMEIPLLHLEKAGIDLFRNSGSVHISPDCLTAGFIQPFEVACGTHPGIISDMQPFYVLLGLKAAGLSRIYDYRYPKRIAYIQELEKFCPGALQAKEGQITIRGVAKFSCSAATSTDLRGSMALIMAAIAAPGTSRIKEVGMALRGYNDLMGKLAQLGITVYPEYTSEALVNY